LPRTLGKFEDKDMTVAIGRFVPYIRHNNQFVSLPKAYDPYKVSSEEAIDLILEKRKKDSEKIIKTFEEDPDMQLLNGRYGPYLAYKKKNFKLPKGSVPAEMVFEDCLKIVKEDTSTEKTSASKDEKPSAKASGKKSTTKQSAAKKTTAKKK
ncbi:MAG: topoisomerase C-terminal repeat-containing protein, partial [Dysgonomonas sp.]